MKASEKAKETVRQDLSETLSLAIQTLPNRLSRTLHCSALILCQASGLKMPNLKPKAYTSLYNDIRRGSLDSLLFSIPIQVYTGPFFSDHLSQEVVKKEETAKKAEKTKPMQGQANGKGAEGTSLVKHKHRDCTFLSNVAVKCGV